MGVRKLDKFAFCDVSALKNYSLIIDNYSLNPSVEALRYE